MVLVFCGTPEFAVPTLKKLVEAGHYVRVVVTQPDRPSGRGQELAAPPVKRLAQSLDCPSSSRTRSRTTWNSARSSKR